MNMSVRSTAPDLGRKSKLRLKIEGLQPGQWLNTGKPASRQNTRALVSMCRAAEGVTEQEYRVRGDKVKNTTWVYCVDPQADMERP